jgi:predicted metalloendopeptidase
MDRKASPCSDLFRYANGAWLDTVSMPAEYNRVGTGREVFDKNQEVVHQVLERAAANAATEKDPSLRKAGHLYAALMDSARAEREGAAPIAPALQEIDAIQSRAQLIAEFGRLTRNGIGIPVTLWPEPDPDHSSQNIAQIFQSGMGLPERDYYFRSDSATVATRQAYVDYVRHMFELLGQPPERARADADAVMRLETALAESALTRVQMRDPRTLYHRMTVKELGALAPQFDWGAYLTAAGLPALGRPAVQLDASTPAFTKRMAALLESEPLDTWKAWLRLNVAGRSAPWLSRAFFDTQFAFTSRLTGQKAPLPRWKRAAAAMDNAMGEAVGKAYAAATFPPRSKKQMLVIVSNLRASMAERIAAAGWMSDATKRQARRKLDAILLKIGYPDVWRDYGPLQIDPASSASEDLTRAEAFETHRKLAQIGKPVDRTEWGMTPATVNAYYNPQVNEIVFPAGILQPPFFVPSDDGASNYGAIGAVIGHEITHGFDDEGRQYDAEGNLKSWWTPEDDRHFKARADAVVQQYNGYVAVDTLHVNGQLTLGENIADIGGLTIAYHAWKLSLRGKPEPPTIGGFTPDQRFFIAFAQSWRSKVRPEALRTQVLTNPHSPAPWRANGAVEDMPEFHRAFGCAEDASTSTSKKRETIW